MAVSIKVNLDVDISKGLNKIREEIKSLEDDLDFDVDDIISGEIDSDSLFNDDIDINDIISGELDENINIGDDSDTSLGINDDRIVNKLESIRRGLGQGSVSRGRLPLNKTLSQRVIGRPTDDGDGGNKGNIFDPLSIAENLESDTDRDLSRPIYTNLLDDDMSLLSSFAPNIKDIGLGDSKPINSGSVSQQRLDRFSFRTSNLEANRLDIGLGTVKDGIIDRELLNIINERRDLDFDKLSNAKSYIGMSDFDNRSLLRFFEGFDAIEGKALSVRKILAKVKPTMGRMYSIIALLLPAVGALAVQMGSLAIAMGGILGIGAGVTLLGALGGEADTLAGSVTNLENRMKDFKQALFQAIQPAADQFAPLFNAVLESIVTNVGRVADKVRAFDNMEGFLTAGIRGAATMFNDIADAFLKFKPQIKAVTAALGSLILTNAGNFFEALIKEGLNSVGTIMQVMNGLFMLGRVVFAILKNILNFVAVLSGLSGILSFVADILGSKLFQSLFIVGTVVATVIGVLYVLFAVFNMLISSAILAGGVLSGTFLSSLIQTIPVLGTLIAQLTIAQKLLLGIAAIASAFTIGAVAVGAIGSYSAINNSIDTPNGLDGYNGTGGSMGNTNIVNNNTFNVQNPNEEDMQAMKDIAGRTIQRDKIGNGDFTLT